MTRQESQKSKEARARRAEKLCDAVLIWRRLAANGQYPRSLHHILRKALAREYALGKSRRADR